MEEKIENVDKIIEYWKNSSNQDFQTMNNLVDSKDYSWALFIGHLVLEKLLKAMYVKKYNTHAIPIHDLLRLARKVELQLTEEQEDWLDTISTFNINARYDNYKFDFHALCTKEFTNIWIERISELRLWLIKRL